MKSRHILLKICAVAACSLMLGPASGIARPVDQLSELRSTRRAKLRAHSLTAAKTAHPATFGLLVIPVDFSDARLPADWTVAEISARLTARSGESLTHYFQVASSGLLDLQITVVPPVHLAENRRLYSDRDLNGFTRTRKLAAEAIGRVAETGLEFGRLDTDGPDGRPGTADDDGQVDGVLILHAGPGQENDPQDGLVQALQFFLAEPIVSRGVAASFYAVASLASGPGIWAHETAHLLGLEDRYDPLLHAAGASEVRSVGGLGRFSLMSSGAWGTGDGYGAALPDAYSSWQLGWRTANTPEAAGPIATTLQPGQAMRVWTSGQTGPEFFLLEVRDPLGSAPFDAAVPGDGLVVYHIDERLPEGAWAEDGPGRWHLRARLVEADGDGALAAGRDDGSLADLFPGSTGATAFSGSTTPATNAYGGDPTFVAVTSITRGAEGVRFDLTTESRLTVDFSYAFTGDEGVRNLSLSVVETGQPLPGLTVELTGLAGDETGSFAATGTRTIQFDCEETTPGIWRPAAPVMWELDGNQDPATVTRFTFRLTGPEQVYRVATREWLWDSNPAAVDFTGSWPGDWTIAYPEGDKQTTWQRWPASAVPGAPGKYILACTGAEYGAGAQWPHVSYGNAAYTTLTSPPLAGSHAGVRLTHAIETEMLSPGIAMDGGTVVWVGPDGAEREAVPVEGYPGRISPQSRNPLHGRAAYGGELLELDEQRLVWQTSFLPLPPAGPGPWRLRLVFAANTIWRARGWFIGEIEAIAAGAAAPTIGLQWDGDLRWQWPFADGARRTFAIETRLTENNAWEQTIRADFDRDPAGWYRLAGSVLLGSGEYTRQQKLQVRVVGAAGTGEVASLPIVVYPEEIADPGVMGLPWPNPAPGEIRFLLDLPRDTPAQLQVYDLRGRLVAVRDYAGGRQLAVWDGLTSDGARAGAGTYFLRLEGSGQVLTRKVVLLH